jgi:RNA polymerase I-specific transcription initiation factor RRN7
MAQTPNPPGHPTSLDDPSTSRDGATAGPDEEKHDDDKGEFSDSEEGDQTEKEEGVDPDLLAELSDLSDDTEMDEVDTRETGSGPKWKRRRRLRVSDTLVTLILGLWTLRVPIMGVDIES